VTAVIDGHCMNAPVPACQRNGDDHDAWDITRGLHGRAVGGARDWYGMGWSPSDRSRNAPISTSGSTEIPGPVGLADADVRAQSFDQVGHLPVEVPCK
jgi:hypothetical protein